MMRISALLNDTGPTQPSRVLHTPSRSSRSIALEHASSTAVTSRQSPTPVPKTASKTKAKESKDAAKFERGNTTCAVNYPPFEIVDVHQKQLLDSFDIYPKTDIGGYPRHIPYTSEKKEFQIQTGRDSFEGTLSPAMKQTLANVENSLPIYLQA